MVISTSRLPSEEAFENMSDEEIKVELKPECKGSALANPHDPEAQYNGHKKEAGVKATVSETCSADEGTENPQIMTNVDVQPANVSDIDILQPSIEEREERGLKPELELTDNGFESDATTRPCRKMKWISSLHLLEKHRRGSGSSTLSVATMAAQLFVAPLDKSARGTR